MDGEIIIDRRNTNVMKLDDNEQALMNEIEIDIPRPACKKTNFKNEDTIYTTRTTSLPGRHGLFCKSK